MKMAKSGGDLIQNSLTRARAHTRYETHPKNVHNKITYKTVYNMI